MSPRGYYKAGEYGFTNDPDLLAATQAWRDAAVADGWSVEPTYGDHEPVESAAKLTRQGWVCLILTRTKEAGRKWRFEAEVSVWAPDRLRVETPAFYDFEALVAGTRVCSACKAADVETQRFSFAGRCCAACRPEMARQTEQGNWTA